MDTLKVEGVSRQVDGDYPCDVAGLVDIASAEALTVREANFVRDFSGARGGEIVESFLAGDMAVQSALAMVILRRAGKPLLDSTVLDLKAGWARFEVGVEESDPPTVEGATPSISGGTTSSTRSESQEDDLSRIGAPV